MQFDNYILGYEHLATQNFGCHKVQMKYNALFKFYNLENNVHRVIFIPDEIPYFRNVIKAV